MICGRKKFNWTPLFPLGKNWARILLFICCLKMKFEELRVLENNKTGGSRRTERTAWYSNSRRNLSKNIRGCILQGKQFSWSHFSQITGREKKKTTNNSNSHSGRWKLLAILYYLKYRLSTKKLWHMQRKKMWPVHEMGGKQVIETAPK